MHPEENRLQYYIRFDGIVFAGPYKSVGNFHYKNVNTDAFCSSDIPKYCVEITPIQASEHLMHLGEILEQEESAWDEPDYEMPF